MSATFCTGTGHAGRFWPRTLTVAARIVAAVAAVNINLARIMNTLEETCGSPESARRLSGRHTNQGCAGHPPKQFLVLRCAHEILASHAGVLPCEALGSRA